LCSSAAVIAPHYSLDGGEDADALFGEGGSDTLTTDERIIHDQSTGALYYDADGVGGVSAVQFAVLGTTSHPTLGAGDFVVVG